MVQHTFRLEKHTNCVTYNLKLPYYCIQFSPHDGVLCLLRDWYLRREDERLLPRHDLLVRLLGRLRAERGVAHKHLVHDHAERPPVTRRRVTGL